MIQTDSENRHDIASMGTSGSGKVCGSFGHGLILGRRPCPSNRPYKHIQGKINGHGLSTKNKPCPKYWQTVPTLGMLLTIDGRTHPKCNRALHNPFCVQGALRSTWSAQNSCRHGFRKCDFGAIFVTVTVIRPLSDAFLLSSYRTRTAFGRIHVKRFCHVPLFRTPESKETRCRRVFLSLIRS